MSDNKNIDVPPRRGKPDVPDPDIALPTSQVSSVAGSVQTAKTHPRPTSSSDRQIKFERAQKCLENAALVSKRIKEHRKATAELLGRPFEDDDGGDTASELASTMSERTGYSVATDTSTTLSVQDALNIPGISESLANTLKQKEILMERIKQYKEISKRPMKTSPIVKKETTSEVRADVKKSKDNVDVTQLLNTIKEKENALSVYQVRVKAMETTILELQEKINEKDQLIDAKNKATTLMSDSLSKKDKDSVALLEDTRQQMIKMQENFVNMEAEWKEEKKRLIKLIEEKDDKIANLEEANTILENSRFEISIAHSKVVDELNIKKQEIIDLQEKLEKLSKEEIRKDQELSTKEKADVEEEKGSLEIANMVELTKKVELLEQLNCQIRQTNKELENKIASMNQESKLTPTSSPAKKASPVPTRKGGRSTAKKSPWSQLSSESPTQDTDKKPNKSEVAKLEQVVQSLNKDILDKEYLISQKDSIISELQTTIIQNETIINELKSQSRMPTDVVDVGICTEIIEDTPKHEVAPFSEPTELISSETLGDADVKDLIAKLLASEEQIKALTTEIDAANKNMIKVKSTHKLKLKQMQKTIDSFSKVSDANAEIIKLNEEIHQLSQKVAELEEEKGNLQLHLVDYDSGRLTESDVYKKMIEMENLAEARLKAISMLETQKFDLVQELHELQQKNVDMEDKLADMSHLHSEQVSSEIKSVQLEEQIDQLHASNNELKLVIENLKLDKDQLAGALKRYEEEKEELLHKLEHYIQENMELTDKLEKLSAEKVSSAESIEIVESLTTQEKLELEEYNKGMSEHKDEDSNVEIPQLPEKQNIEELLKQSAELNMKIELFTQERQEVMEKMNKLSTENESLHKKTTELNHQCSDLKNNIELLNNEKIELNKLNEELNGQVEELKRERLEIMKESIELVKPTSVEEAAEGVASEQNDDKNSGEKGINRTKSVKQLTKEILKLKNIIKEREAEIGDCQMKILSLEEQQQKHNELIQVHSSYESKLRALTDENNQLKDELETTKKDRALELQLAQYQQAQELMQQEIQKLHNDYSATINSRDARLQELENVLLEYEKQIFNYGSTLQQKDKEMSEYINQITKLNDVSQKLKSTIEILEEEKAKDPNAELVKTLNKQISANQKKLLECEEHLRKLEEEKGQLISLKGALENRNIGLEAELKKLQEALMEKQTLIKEMQSQQQKNSEEMSNVTSQLKERDEEIHEIKLQLRKESIENEKLRNSLSEKENISEEFTKELEDAKEKITKLTLEKDEIREQCTAMETKNKELMEKLKKFAASVKKKSALYTELENQMNETQKELENKTLQIEQLSMQVESVPALEKKIKFAEEQLNSLQSQKVNFEQQKSHDITHLQAEIKTLQDELNSTVTELSKVNDNLNLAHKELYLTQEENNKLKLQIDFLNNKVADYEVEQKNNLNYTTKISSLEADISQKQIEITDLISKLEAYSQQLNQLQFGQDAKLQERDLYIESLETEINKYKSRICRLEESISVMEDRRHTLERKADQLGSQLQEKQKAYSEYTSQEDELVSRLAVLMDHDRVVEKQLHEIENENKELQYKTQHLQEENHRLRKSLSDIQDHCNTLVDKASRTDFAESELAKYQTQLHELDGQLKRLTHEHQNLFVERKKQIEDIEAEFNTQIENAIKEKKSLSEKYEKIIELVTKLENKLQEYRNTIENLKINIEELSRLNNELEAKSFREPAQTPDYTEQYINEINRLNAMVNSKNQEVFELHNNLQSLQTSNMSVTSSLESNISELNNKLKHSSTVIEQLMQEINDLKSSNERLELCLSEKEEQIKRLIEEKSVTFEMSIPKTEGMTISSTIEPVREGPKLSDVSMIESQIVLEGEERHTKLRVSEHQQKSSDLVDNSGIINEPEIVAKKAYLCYNEENQPEQSDDPFNSDEGWGFGETEDVAGVTPGLTHLNNEILQLKKQNEQLKSDLDATNSKLLKALKKLKELKTNNDMLSNELKISKQISQSSFLDSAIEDEMKINIQALEKRIEELTSDLIKEKKEKESLRKQNEVINNANDKLTDMKEKLDSEIELWKYKFKEANDKVSTLQWDSKDSPDHKPISKTISVKEDKEKIKLENENEELQSMIDQLTSQNKELLAQLKVQASNKKSQENYDALKNSLLELQNSNTELQKSKSDLNEQLQDLEQRYNEILQQNKINLGKREELEIMLENKNKQVVEITARLEDEIQMLRNAQVEATDKISALISELEEAKLKLLLHEEQQNTKKVDTFDTFSLTEKYNSMEDQFMQLQRELEVANEKTLQLKTENQSLLQKIQEYEQQIEVLNEKLDHLNTENDQLLSTVAELRNSVSSAVDQRGFEIAELWKQHLAQRETDFQKTEQELRSQLTAYETKYEQLLDSVQSSSQEETEKLITMEQISSLQNKLQDKEEHLRDLQDKYAEVMNQMDMLRSEIEDEKTMVENKLLAQQEEYEKQILEISNKNQELEKYEALYNQLQNEVTVTKSGCSDELAQKTKELQESEEKIINLTTQLRMKERELHQKTHDFTITLTQKNEEFENVRKVLVEYEKKIEDLAYEKESELAVLRLKMHEIDEDYSRAQQDIEEEKLSLTQELNAKIIECTNLNKQMTDLRKLLEEESKNSAEMQAALESQEIEIVSLKEALRSSGSKIEKHVTFASDTKPGTSDAPEETGNVLDKELLDAVPRAELDLAMYMLHQRDVRCEELTMELTQLLEERDTLQLRLSDSLRSYEELKFKCKSAGLDVSASASQEAIADLPTFAVERESHFVETHRGQTSRSSSISDPDGEKANLQAKLSELRSVKHSRDVRFRQDSEQRQLEVRLLQRDVANLPPEAVDQLAQAHHTLSRDSQSTSTVLLNWLRGKSTPKVVHM